MMTYGAYSEVEEPFSSLEAATESLSYLPWMLGRKVTAVSMVTRQDSQGVHAEVVSGETHSDDADAVVFLVDVRHGVLGETIDIQYLIEFGGVELGEDGESTDGFEPEPGNEEDSEEPDGSVEQGSEIPGDVPTAGGSSDPVD